MNRFRLPECLKAFTFQLQREYAIRERLSEEDEKALDRSWEYAAKKRGLSRERVYPTGERLAYLLKQKEIYEWQRVEAWCQTVVIKR